MVTEMLILLVFHLFCGLEIFNGITYGESPFILFSVSESSKVLNPTQVWGSSGDVYKTKQNKQNKYRQHMLGTG